MAMGKARLASAFRKPTAQLMEQWKDRPLFPQSLTTVLPGEITLNPGGYPIFENGEFVGAIGVGGGSPTQDDAVARLASGWTEAQTESRTGQKTGSGPRTSHTRQARSTARGACPAGDTRTSPGQTSGSG